jgi:hypothetical protein
VTLNPARLARFADWVTTLPLRPLPRTVIPLPGEYHLNYVRRLAEANHLELPELTGALDDTGAIIVHGTLDWKRHQQQRLAAAASQPLARITRLWWPDPGIYLRDPEGFHQMLRPACRRCTARRGIAGPVACHLPPHLTICRRHRLWIGPSARSHGGQLDVSHLPAIFRAQRRHLTQLHHHRWWDVQAAISDAAHAIHSALRIGAWTLPQRQRLHQLDPGTWPQTAPEPGPGWQYDLSGNPVIQIAIYPDIIRLAAYNLHSIGTGRREAP